MVDLVNGAVADARDMGIIESYLLKVLSPPVILISSERLSSEQVKQRKNLFE